VQKIESFLMDHIGEKIEQMEEVLLEMPQVDIPVENLFVNGMYARKIMIPRDTILTGRVHLADYVDIMLSGDITVATPDGVKRFTGFNIFEGKQGRKRAGYAHEDTHWVTVHRTEIKDPDEYVNAMTVFNMTAYKKIEKDRAGYESFISGMGMSEDEVQVQVQNTEDFESFNSENYYLSPSPIHGIGFFAGQRFEIGSEILIARIDDKRTEAGRFVNHSESPNAEMRYVGANIYLFALKEINKGEEITTSYKATVEKLSGGEICHQ